MDDRMMMLKYDLDFAKMVVREQLEYLMKK